MALRLAMMRRSTSLKPLGYKGVMADAKSFSFSEFFSEKNFWGKANVGPFFLLLLFTPSIYRSFKDFYWTRQLRKLNTEEIISDRYEWLRISMLKDEVEAVLLTQAPATSE
eukprot:gnl/TRDRNA2_/TRDRNA2_182732_c0_seq1.p1 gnl/TRDRNA2_/TRDRNA2_182732_c0~~gnl/TRDRNA2_/TRDRNA2_182732_c0_seq1.p1  ORF type:complete len:111 (+),score=31.67 gnl/TRDRNA2_/TRDRNA2_182732_c0_seq1:160-492(+)